MSKPTFDLFAVYNSGSEYLHSDMPLTTVLDEIDEYLTVAPSKIFELKVRRHVD